jgi:DNA-binding GntR family transcriptional regulator
LDSTQRIYDEIYRAVLDHRLPPGTKLKETELADIFGVSRTIVRQTLHRLGQDNIVQLRLNRGAEVARPTLEEAHQIFDARRVIEAAVIRAVVRNIDKRQLGALRALQNAERAAAVRDDANAAIRLSGEFHLKLAEIGGNLVFLKILNELVSRTSLLIALYEAPGRPACIEHDHAELIAAIADGDEARAARSMREHLDEIEARLKVRDQPAARTLAARLSQSPASKARRRSKL